MAAPRTALAKGPSKEAKEPPKTPEQLGLRRAGKGLYRNRKGELTNATGQRVDKTGKLLKEPEKKDDKKTPEKRPVTGPSFKTPFTQQTPEEQVTNIQTGVGQNISDYLKQLQAQGAFNPGEYEDTYQQAYQNVMGQFELQNQQAFQQQNQQIEQMIAERGIDPTGRQAQNLRQQLYKQQDQARQQAMYQAENMGRQLQEQRFQRDLIKYNVPTQQLGALQGYFGGQLGQVEAEKQRQFEAEQAEKQREASKDVARIGGGGGKADPFALMEAEYRYKRDLLYDQAALMGQQKGPNPWNQAAAGFATGVGAGLGRGLAGA